MKKFFWFGDPFKRGIVLVSWRQSCLPKYQGGLGLKNLFTLNKAILRLKRGWDVVQGSSALSNSPINGPEKQCVNRIPILAL